MQAEGFRNFELSAPLDTRHRRRPAWLITGFWACVVIAVAAVIRRLLAIAHPSGGNGLDEAFSSHAALTLTHIIPAAIFVLLAAFVLLRRDRPQWVEQCFFFTGAVTGLTAYPMSAYAIGGWVERSAVFVFDTWFLFSLSRSYLFHRQRNRRKERDWKVRAVGILLGIATTRPVMGVFFATSRATHLSPEQFFGIAFWIGFSINCAIVEFWLRSHRRLA